MPRILIITAHRKDRSPSQRFRFEQYLSFLEENNFEIVFSNLLDEADDKIFYSPGHYFSKFIISLKAAAKRFRDVRSANSFDLIFIQREAFMTFTTYFEKQFSKSNAKIVFDFDDAIWNPDISGANQKFSFLKNPAKTAHIIALSNLIFAGNEYLADYARQFNKNVTIIPTTIDTDEYKKINLPPRQKICIGWSGSITTIKHFEFAIPFLKELKKKYGNAIHIKVIGDGSYTHPALGIKGIAWHKHTEIKELSEIDIGIMPLPDDEWTKGKCGLKGLQYMALEIPTVMSPVGVNTEIIADGTNGFLASQTHEWVEKISALIESEALRIKLGQAARKTVEQHFSVQSQKENYLRHFNQLIAQ